MKLILLCLFLTSSAAFSQIVTKVTDDQISIRLSDEDADYYERGDIVYLSDEDQQETVYEAEVIRSRGRFVKMKCRNSCSSLKVNTLVSVSESKDKKDEPEQRPALRSQRIVGLSLGRPFKSGYQAYDQAIASYSMQEEEGSYVDLFLDWYEEQSKEQFYRFGIGFFLSQMKAERGSDKISYDCNGVSLRFGFSFKISHGISYSIGFEKRIPFLEKMKVTNDLLSFSVEPSDNDFAFVDVATHTLHYNFSDDMRVFVAIDDEAIAGPLAGLTSNYFSRFDRSGVSSYKMGVDIEI